MVIWVLGDTSSCRQSTQGHSHVDSEGVRTAFWNFTTYVHLIGEAPKKYFLEDELRNGALPTSRPTF
jgi:hypothetical protein